MEQNYNLSKEKDTESPLRLLKRAIIEILRNFRIFTHWPKLLRSIIEK